MRELREYNGSGDDSDGGWAMAEAKATRASFRITRRVVGHTTFVPLIYRSR